MSGAGAGSSGEERGCSDRGRTAARSLGGRLLGPGQEIDVVHDSVCIQGRQGCIVLMRSLVKGKVDDEGLA